LNAIILTWNGGKGKGKVRDVLVMRKGVSPSPGMWKFVVLARLVQSLAIARLPFSFADNSSLSI
jgi:hypothetical protein